MHCLLGLFALITPRVVIILVLLFSTYLQDAYQTLLWPLLGFLFLPIATLTYAFVMNEHGELAGAFLVVFIAAILLDLGIVGSGKAVTVRER